MYSRNLKTDIEIQLEEALKPELHREQEKLLGDRRMNWTLLVDGKRIYGPSRICGPSQRRDMSSMQANSIQTQNSWPPYTLQQMQVGPRPTLWRLLIHELIIFIFYHFRGSTILLPQNLIKILGLFVKGWGECELK
ncbi:hypothetical protein SCA6_006394 [Theobroma cacao]